MKVAVSATQKNLDAPIDPRFGRCGHFIIVETEDMGFDCFDNDQAALGGGAGVQSAQFISTKGAEVLITGNIGPNAMRTLSAAGIKVVTGQSGTVKQAILDYKSGKLSAVSEASVPEHFGMGGGGRGRGSGMGSGKGGGRGRGSGMGQGGQGGGIRRMK